MFPNYFTNQFANLEMTSTQIKILGFQLPSTYGMYINTWVVWNFCKWKITIKTSQHPITMQIIFH
jgi:hypothetical protein